MPLSPVPLLDEPTALRRLHAGEAPYPGRLHATDPPSVWVDLDLVPDAVWHCDPGGHLLVPIDIARARGGHAAIVPHCRLRLSAAAAAATPGEAVTIAVSVLRAAFEARGAGIEDGTWWVDADGRPVLAAAGGAAWAPEAAAILDELAVGAEPPLADALEAAKGLVERRRMPPEELARCETELFDAAEPCALAPYESRRARAAAQPSVAGMLRREERPEPHPLLSALASADWSERVAVALRSLSAAPGALRERLTARAARRRAAAPGPGRVEPRSSGETPPRRGTQRRRTWVVAAAVAAAVVAVGMLWPVAGGDGVRAAIPTDGPAGNSPTQSPAGVAAAPGAHDSGAGERGADDSGGEESGEASGDDDPGTVVGSGIADVGDGTARPADLVAAARTALGALAACGATPTSCSRVMEDPAASVRQGAATAGDSTATVTLLDEYGGVAVFRVESPGLSAQILVLVADDRGWLVRDVYDLADQP